MPKFTTEIRAIDPLTGKMKTWCGPYVDAITWGMAEEWCRLNCGYLKVMGELVSEIPCKPNTHEPDWDGQIDFDQHLN